MCLASTQAIWAWFNARHTHDPSYLRFLDSFGTQPLSHMRTYAALMDNHANPLALQSSPDLLAVNALRAKQSLPPVDLLSPHAGCSIIHPLHPTDCLRAQTAFFLGTLRRAVPLYAPVYLLPQLLFRPWRELLHLSTFGHVAGSLARSSVFLSAYCTVGTSSKRPVAGAIPGVRARACERMCDKPWVVVVRACVCGVYCTDR